VLAWERRDNHERFSMALNGLTPAEQLATFTAAPSPLTSLTVPPPVFRSPLTSTMDRPPIACPEPRVAWRATRWPCRFVGGTAGRL
jgi:hypothetical protein